ncbi:MAG TPA: Maf family nucleotide pyrophosphatase [Lentimicrobium sp.]|nr:Maf family nucleotide pyrophosphatase [Lentimicrobium sp.]
MIDLNNSGFRFILASQSPRRQFLLHETGLDFDIIVKPTSEEYPQELSAQDIALYVSKQKAFEFDFDELPDNALIITADTIVWLNNESIGKPQNADEAKQMLRKLSGKMHVVSTGVCFRTAQRFHTFYVNTDVYFRELKEYEIEYYVNKYKPFDKAGAYGVQEWIGYVGVEKIEGSYYNVMGLPVQRVYVELKKFLES